MDENYLLDPDEDHEALLVAGMAWSRGDVKIRLEAGDVMDSLDVDIEVLSVHASVNLAMRRWSGRNRIHIDDLNGAQAGSALYGQGYGTLAMNLGIQLIHFYFNIPMGHPQARMFSVTGSISHQAAPGAPGSQEYMEDAARRVAFWQRFGFWVREETHLKLPMKANLEDLRLLDGPDTPHGIPRTLPLSRFTPVSQSCGHPRGHLREGKLYLLTGLNQQVRQPRGFDTVTYLNHRHTDLIERVRDVRQVKTS